MPTDYAQPTDRVLAEYLQHHKSMMLGAIRGLVDVRIQRDEEGLYIDLIVEEQADDTRSMDPEHIAQNMIWNNPEPTKARCKVTHR